MSERRRDNRNRILQVGEYQRADGRYRYRYIDENGQENNVYSWRLEKNDRMPKGKKPELASVIVNDSVTREAITRKQQRDFLNFVKEDKYYNKYYDAFYFLFHTGLRISEFCGLTMSDIEFDQNRIHVDHQLQRTSEMKYVIQEPKTEKGVRYVPMTDEVAMCFRRIIKNRKKPRKEPMIDGHAGFLCLDKNEMPMVALHWEKYMEHVVAKYNKTYRVQLPKITPHVCRHTFCSNMAKSGMNPKTLQYIMGHSDISVTLNTYTHVGFDDAKQELLRVAGR